MTTIDLAFGPDRVAVLTIDVRDRPMNVLTDDFIADLATAVDRIAADPQVRGAVITSGKSNGFLAGADLKDLVTAYDAGVTAVEGAAKSAHYSALLRRMETCGKPFAAAINGLALGGGLELCLACHHRVLSEETSAQIGLPEVKVGLLPGAGGTQRLPRLIGIPAALPLLLEGKSLKPADALRLGIVHALAPAAELVETARRWASSSAGEEASHQPWDRKGFRVPGGVGPLAAHAGQTFVAGTALTAVATGGNFPAPLAILSCVYEGTQVALDVGLRVESKYFGKLLSDPVARNLTRTLFINKGAADKLAARPKDIPRASFTKIGVLGAGLMGAGVAHVTAQAGIEVVLLDSTRALADKGKSRIAALQAQELTRGRSTQTKMDAVLGRIHASCDYADLAGCELVIEAVYEKREIKAEVTRKAQEVIASEAVFGSNTSTLPITSLARAALRPEQFVGVHFFSPVEKMPLVEIIAGEQTSPATIARALDYVAALRKTPIVVRDSPGFFTSRVFGTFVNEGMKMLLEGVAPALIENAARIAGFPVGPLAVSDEVSLALQQSIYKQQDLDGIAERYRSTVGRPAIDRMVDELKRTGRRGGAGFYDYPEREPKKLWPGLGRAFPAAESQPDVAQLKQRFLTIMALETARCLEEGVISNPADADIGSILGIGYPAWTGGALSYIDTLGIGRFVDECRSLASRLGPRFAPSPWLTERARCNTSFYAAARTA